MDSKLENAIRAMVEIEEQAASNQKEKGIIDVGKRSAVTAGEHLDPLANEFRQRLIDLGIAPKNIKTQKKDLSLPGWFRRDKAWDLLAYSEDSLAAAIELKSITDSFGNNTNNRIEEAVGSAEDFRVAKQKGLLGANTFPPFTGFVMVIYETEKSTRPVKNKQLDDRLFPDAAFNETSYIQRFGIALERMIQENLYDSARLVVLNPTTREIKEPFRKLDFEHFWSLLKAKALAILN